MEITDEELVRKYLEGDEKAFGDLFNRYKNRLYPYLVSICLDKTLAEDIFQETFIKAVEKLPSYRSENKFSSWLFAIARNIFLDRKKSSKEKFFQAALSIFSSGDDDGFSPVDTAAEKDNPQTILDSKEESAKLIKAMENLPPEQREIISLRHFAGLSFKEIAENLNIPIGTALARFSRGIEKLKKGIKDMQ